MPNPRILAFDLGGVLATHDNSSLLAATGVTEETINLKYVVTHFEQGSIDWASFYKFARKQFRVDCSEEAFCAAWKATVRLDIEMIGVLKAVTALGLGLAVMTNLDIVRAVALQELLANQGLNNVTICCSGEFGYTKPSRSFFDSAAKQIGQIAK
jgi:FMN phosphatase YigB (HAD superfamily)